jgi:hypothetical protein
MPVADYVLLDPIVLEGSLPTAPTFSADGSSLLFGDRMTPRLLVVDLASSEIRQVPLPFVALDLEVAEGGRTLFIVGQDEASRVGIARVDLETWVTETAKLPFVQRVTDLAIGPHGDRLFLGDGECNCLYDLKLPALFEENDDSTSALRTHRRLYLENGPAAEIEALGGGERVLVVHQEAYTTMAQGAPRKAGPELSLIETEKGTLVDSYWSQRGWGTGSIVSVTRGPEAVRYVVALEEDAARTIVAYRVDGIALSSRPVAVTSWPPSRHFLAGQLRLAGSADGGTLVMYLPGERDLGIVRLEAADEDDDLEPARQWTLRAPGRVEAVAVSRDGHHLAVAIERSIALYRFQAE